MPLRVHPQASFPLEIKVPPKTLQAISMAFPRRTSKRPWVLSIDRYVYALSLSVLLSMHVLYYSLSIYTPAH
jgi:hypothetical protein